GRGARASRARRALAHGLRPRRDRGRDLSRATRARGWAPARHGHARARRVGAARVRRAHLALRGRAGDGREPGDRDDRGPGGGLLRRRDRGGRGALVPGARRAADDAVLGAHGERHPDLHRRRAPARGGTGGGDRARRHRLQPDRLRADRPDRRAADVRRPAWLLLLGVLAAACAVPLAPPPSAPPDGDEPPRRGGVLHEASGEDPRYLDPAKGYDTVSWGLEQMLFSTLVDYDAGTTIVPELAESWTLSPDGRHVGFTLRHDLVFSTGRPMTAADVKYSLERLLRPAIHSQGAEFFHGIEGAKEYVAGVAKEVRGIRAPAPDRIEFDLTAVDPLFLHKLTMPFAAVVDREAAERFGDEDFTRHPV